MSLNINTPIGKIANFLWGNGNEQDTTSLEEKSINSKEKLELDQNDIINYLY